MVKFLDKTEGNFKNIGRMHEINSRKKFQENLKTSKRKLYRNLWSNLQKFDGNFLNV